MRGGFIYESVGNVNSALVTSEGAFQGQEFRTNYRNKAGN